MGDSLSGHSDDEPESLLRSDLGYLDLVAQMVDQCDSMLEVSPGHVHYCTRPEGHRGQHYSFRGGDYEILWPATSQIAT